MHSSSAQVLTDALHATAETAREVGGEVRAGATGIAEAASDRLAAARRRGRRAARQGRKSAARAARRAESHAERVRAGALASASAVQEQAAALAERVPGVIAERVPSRVSPAARRRRARVKQAVTALVVTGFVVAVGRIVWRRVCGGAEPQPLTAPIRGAARSTDPPPGAVRSVDAGSDDPTGPRR